MAIIYVASSKTVQEWAADVGLGKNVFKVGVAEDAASLDQSLAGVAGADDWKVLKSAEWDGDEDAALARLGKKEKVIDPTYYPKLRGTLGVVKVDPAAVENAMLIALALEGRETPKTFKVKPADMAQYLIRNLSKG